MANNGERSGLFKFFYVILSIITFPIFVIIYVLRHPVVVLFILLVLAGVLAYFPMRDGVDLNGAVDWYKKKYVDVKYAVVEKAVESGGASLVSQKVLDDMQKTKEDLEAKKEEVDRVKSELYNDKVKRDKDFDNKIQKMKKRGGFKKSEPLLEEEEEKDVDVSQVVEDAGNVGGLLAIIANGQGDEKEEYSDPILCSTHYNGQGDEKEENSDVVNSKEDKLLEESSNKEEESLLSLEEIEELLESVEDNSDVETEENMLDLDF